MGNLRDLGTASHQQCFFPPETVANARQATRPNSIQQPTVLLHRATLAAVHAALERGDIVASIRKHSHTYSSNIWSALYHHKSTPGHSPSPSPGVQCLVSDESGVAYRVLAAPETGQGP
jgi:hypothetical protein